MKLHSFHPGIATLMTVLFSAGVCASASDQISPRIDDVITSLATVEAQLVGNDIPAFLETMVGTSPNLLEQADRLDDVIDVFLDQMSDVAGAELDANPGFLLAYDDAQADSEGLQTQVSFFMNRARQLSIGILTGEFADASDVMYLAEKERLLSEIPGLEIQLAATKLSLEGLDALITTSLPAFARLDIDSLGCGAGFANDFISASGESCMLTAELTNLEPAGGLTLSNLSVEFSIFSLLEAPDNGLTNLSFLSSPTAASPDLAPGASARLNWEFAYEGDMSFENLLLDLEVKENGVEPVSFAANAGRSDVAVWSDPDNDGLPSNWETENGLDPLSDDAQADFDGDGISNEREYELGTMPSNDDSDGDGLTDGEEITTGKRNLFITDPLNPDTDGDGVNDKSDGAPLDLWQTRGGNPVPEAAVGVNQTEIILSNDAPVQLVQVSNTADGVLRWAAVVENDAITMTNPGHDSTQTGTGYLSVNPPYSGHDFNLTAGAETIIRVGDVSGNDKDYQDIRVCHVFCGDGGGDGGGTPSSIDAALQKLSASKSAKCSAPSVGLTVTVKNNGGETVSGELHLTGTAEVDGEVLNLVEPITLLDTAKRGLTTFDYEFAPAGKLSTAQTVNWTATVTIPGDSNTGNDQASAATKFAGSCP